MTIRAALPARNAKMNLGSLPRKSEPVRRPRDVHRRKTSLSPEVLQALIKDFQSHAENDTELVFPRKVPAIGIVRAFNLGYILVAKSNS